MSRANSSATLSSSTSRALSRVLAGPPGETDEHEGRKLSQPQKELLYLAHNHGALRFGEFKLKSGRTSPFFFNAGMFGNGEAMELISKAYATEIVRSGVEFDLLFGSAYKGIPLVACTAMSLNRVYSRPAPFIYDRKEVKDHGEGGNLIGALNELKPKLIPGTTDQYRPPRVLLIDDVLTSGTAIRASMKLLRELQPDVEVAAICVMLDRQERVSEESNLSAAEQLALDCKTTVLSVLNITDMLLFLDELISSGDDLESRATLQKARNDLIEYRRKYGVTDELPTDVL
ncbi:orotate phosphoribosyltransferase [Besnoitia besnoiti]|uniref:orotate phosphoribosyltransferase n=1 Tax=Besnoitia besnoiti TaxID=94643 RepID=A0A2A9MPZ7_BESBE|nr:orotate phosphoribosyltransferase [Besnoitia besnoiti]PFH37962.1 orotate phosphoribosyltransferase [Besnoitia besnoiti]